ncbi:DUF4097 family beta strand repeat-containing protein [Shimazuella kribbensis]|uniref:DUF4097 family beta strand repeat-containing protein n=1 Tax=Shimazuella kribbensis TaxID=139808 RepID=UPI0003FD758B|nr:DUF4097 family beta strand repeat-containing protein [Shimazuella kribbensis]
MKKIIYVGIILFIIGLVGSGAMIYKKVGLKTEAPFKHEEKADGTLITNVMVTSKSVDIEIYPSANNQITATFTGTKQKNVTTNLQLTTNGNTVQINAKREEVNSRSWINFDLNTIKQPTKVAVYLPKKQYETLTLQTNHGDIKIEDFKGKIAKATTNNGDIRLKNTDATLAVQSSHGDIQLQESITLNGNNSISTTSGDIDVQSNYDPNNTSNNKTTSLNLQTSHGDIHLNGYQGNQLTAKSNSGDVTVQNIDTTFNIRSNNGDIQIQSIKEFRANNQVNTSNGDIAVSVGHDPKSLNVHFAGSEIQSDFPIQTMGTTTTSDYDNNQPLKGVIGANSADSPMLNMQTNHGNISFGR